MDRSEIKETSAKMRGTRDILIEQFVSLQRQAISKGVEKGIIRKLFLGSAFSGKRSQISKILKKKRQDHQKRCGFLTRHCVLGVAFLALLGFILLSSLFPGFYAVRSYEDFQDVMYTFYESKCLITSGEFTLEASRPLMKCTICENLSQVPVETDLTPERFRKLYAYTNMPVLVKGATVNWTAMMSFSVNFFRDLYSGIDGAYDDQMNECQFFPYRTDFMSLEEVLDMPKARATFQEGEEPWYIGWSNCNKEVQRRLREHYQRPYFLPNDSESSVIDWMFMGGSGPGAFVHLDYVQRPSWQAQISGRKTWTLVPAPECESICRSMNVTVEKGDIFVIDTNVWYHSTFIHPGDISITIGSEYD